MLREDVIGRLIVTLMGGISRIRELLQEQKVEEAETALAAAEQQLGLPPGIERFDAASAALMAGGGDRVVLAAMLLELRAEVAMTRGAEDQADRHRARALTMLQHATPSQLTREAKALEDRLAG
ncbi:MAG TPA: hypothetical protein VIC33_13730 [Vicinamibacterales bacterium]